MIGLHNSYHPEKLMVKPKRRVYSIYPQISHYAEINKWKHHFHHENIAIQLCTCDDKNDKKNAHGKIGMRRTASGHSFIWLGKNYMLNANGCRQELKQQSNKSNDASSVTVAVAEEEETEKMVMMEEGEEEEEEEK